MYTRSPFTEYVVISSHSFVEKNKDKTTTQHMSELVVTISNWHFVRDNLSNPRINRCTLADCAIGLKLSSSVFKPASVAASDKPSEHTYYFDRNGTTIPYEAFFALLQNKDFEEFLNHVKRRYEDSAGPLGINAEEDEDQGHDIAGAPSCSQGTQNQEEAVAEEAEEEEEDCEEAPKSKKAKKQNNKKKA